MAILRLRLIFNLLVITYFSIRLYRSIYALWCVKTYHVKLSNISLGDLKILKSVYPMAIRATTGSCIVLVDWLDNPNDSYELSDNPERWLMMPNAVMIIWPVNIIYEIQYLFCVWTKSLYDAKLEKLIQDDGMTMDEYRKIVYARE